MKIYIAAPLFNEPQRGIIATIEDIITSAGHEFLSPRLGSEPFLPPKDQRKNPAAWLPLFNWNEQSIQECDLLLAVLAYALPPNERICACKLEPKHSEYTDLKVDITVPIRELELPDTGTVWEMGTARGLGKLVVGFHPTKKAEHLNVMLTHGCDGLLSGYSRLALFLDSELSGCIPNSIYDRSRLTSVYGISGELANLPVKAQHFNWSVCEAWAAQQETLPETGPSSGEDTPRMVEVEAEC